MAVVEPVEAPGEGRRRLRLRSPATLEPIGEIEVEPPEAVRAAVDRARKAQREWAALPFRERGRILLRAVDLLLERQDRFVEVIVRETGKPPAEALAMELFPACDALTFFARRAERILADRRVPLHLLRTKRLRVVYKPVGVVGIITPWNFPFVLSLNPTVQALMAGNAVVLKPSEVTPCSGRLVGELLEAAGLPPDVLTVLLGDGETGAALVEAGVDKISFTGSVATGERVAEACGRNLVPCTLELGGKDALIVCEDADLERASSAAVFGAFANAGQACISVERAYVVSEVADAFTRKVVEKTAALRQGPSGEYDLGPMMWDRQLEIVERHVRDAVEKGARVLAGGRRNPEWPGLFYEPTVLVDVRPDMLVMREETFGPVLPIVPVRDAEEAVALANDSPFGLSASVFTRDRRRGEALARALETGSAVVGDVLAAYGALEAPFGGVKRSGIGRVNGEAGLRSFCHTQSVLVERFSRRSEMVWFPHGAAKSRRIRRAMRILWGTPLGRWL